MASKPAATEKSVNSAVCESSDWVLNGGYHGIQRYSENNAQADTAAEFAASTAVFTSFGSSYFIRQVKSRFAGSLPTGR